MHAPQQLLLLLLWKHITCTYFYGWTVTAAAVSILGCNAESVPLPTQQISQSTGRVRGDVG